MTPTKKDTLLFVHGAWHGAWCWEKYFVPYFEKQGYACHTFNLPMHDTPGPKSNINSLSLGDYVQALKQEVHKLDSQPIIIGHSMGGLITQKYLEKDSCKMAILLASVPPTGVLKTTFRFLKKSYAYPSLLLFNLYGLVNSKEKSKHAFFSDNLPDDELQEYTKNMCAESYRVFLNMLVPNIRLNYHQQIPMLVLGAEKDTIFSVEENKSTAKKYKADLEIIPNIAHDMMLDVGREIVMERIHRFIQRINKEQGK